MGTEGARFCSYFVCFRKKNKHHSFLFVAGSDEVLIIFMDAKHDLNGRGTRGMPVYILGGPVHVECWVAPLRRTHVDRRLG